MEKILDENEKIRRAEEIYYRRNNKEIPDKIREKNKSKNKILFELLVMLNISVIVFSIQNKDFIFTKEFLGILNEYNLNITNAITNELKKILSEDSDYELKGDDIKIEENSINSYDNKEEKNSNETDSNLINKNVSSSISEMELDIKNLKAAYSFSKPISGIISSSFGARESEFQNVTGYHKGIDIAKEEGSDIVASMGGIVELVSSEGDYGKHIIIRCNNVRTVYAHCSKLYVKEGQIVAQNQVIAAVGSTGNSTGPHLHFEIRVNDRFVDPSKVISF